MGANTTRESLNVRYDLASWLVTAVGIVLGIAGVAYLVAHPEPITTWGIELVLVSAPAAAIVYGGYWIAAHEVPRSDGWNIAKWCLTGTVVAAVLLFGYVSAEQIGGTTVLDSKLLALLGALGGGAVSLFAAISNERRHLDVALGTDANRLVAAGAESFSADAQAFAELAADTRSWYVIRALGLAEEPLGVESLATQIATLEETDPQKVRTDLVHSRLPKLAAGGLIHYEPDVDVVWPGDRLPSVIQASEELSTVSETIISTEQ
ncbi:DUF7344 domain-containing protein [Natronosalvus caseinilyticus]|uniref:DUF7344 domain-containing protein n=1 Tax=Natronosalvus caseinilyticus TaxID=2953747 RepID=UPI0028B00247|nr:hypothetical protein [Natronosalvus caseinilyticus]